MKAKTERRSYTWDFKAEVLAAYEVDGPAATARAYNVPLRTVKSWAWKVGLHTVADTKSATEAACSKNESLRVELRTRLIEKCIDMLKRMDSPHYEYQGKDGERVVYPVAGARECQSYATALGIMLDKFRLEHGEATVHEEVSHKFAELSDADLLRQAEEITRAAALDE